MPVGDAHRPDYKKLGKLRSAYAGVPMIALTATATEAVKNDIIKCLKLKRHAIFQVSARIKPFAPPAACSTDATDGSHGIRLKPWTIVPEESALADGDQCRSPHTVASGGPPPARADDGP